MPQILTMWYCGCFKLEIQTLPRCVSKSTESTDQRLHSFVMLRNEANESLLNSTHSGASQRIGMALPLVSYM